MKRFLFISILGLLLLRYTFSVGSSIVGQIVYCAIYLIVLSVMFYDIFSKKVTIKKIPGFIYLIIILIYGTLGIIIYQLSVQGGMDLQHHLKSLKGYLFDPIILFFAAFFFIDGEEDAQKSLLSVISLFSILNILSQVLGIFGIEMFLVGEGSEVKGRFTGSFKNANQMAYFMCFLIPYIIYFMKKATNIIGKTVYFTLFFFSVISVLMSGSKGGILALFFVLILIFLKLGQYKFGVAIIIFIALFVITSLVAGHNQYLSRTIERVSVLFSGDLVAAGTGRFHLLWPTLFKIFITGGPLIIFGRGLGTIPQLLMEYGGIYGTAHNLYFQSMIELGLLGSFLCLAFLIKIIYFIKRSEPKEGPLLKNVIYASLSVFLIAMCFSDLALIIKFIALINGVAFSFLHFTNIAMEEKKHETVMRY